MYDRLAIYIPAYNVAPILPKVLQRIPAVLKEGIPEILVVDNSSSDGTGQAALDYAASNGIRNLNLVRNEQNLGYGGSQKRAYRHCIDKGYGVVAMLHGDAQYAPEYLEMLVQPVLNGEADMIFGSRMRGDPLKGGMPLHRYLGNKVLTFLQNLVLGTRLSEFHSGYRVFSVEALKKIPFERLSSDFHFDTEIIVLLLENKLKIAEKPIPTHYGDEPNYVNVWKYGLDVLVTTGTYWLHKRRLRVSKRWSAIFGY